MKHILFCISLLLTFKASAQIKNLMNDPKIGWIAQGSTDIGFDVISYESMKSLEEMRAYYPRPADIIKLEEIKSEFKSDGYHHFAKIFLDAIYNKKVKIYSDSTCSKEIDILSLNTDTIEIIDPITLEKTWKVVLNKFEPEQCVLFRVFQTFIYKPEKGVWEVRTESIAPVFLKATNYGVISLKPIFWVKAGTNKRTSDKNVNWKVRAQTNLWLNHNANVLKKINDEMPLVHFVNYFEENNKIPFYSVEKGWNSKERITDSEKSNLFKVRIDSSEGIDPETFKPKVYETFHIVDSESVRGIRFVQEWHWDKSKNSISSKLVAIAPMLEHTDAYGSYLFAAPLFYRRLGE